MIFNRLQIHRCLELSFIFAYPIILNIHMYRALTLISIYLFLFASINASTVPTSHSFSAAQYESDHPADSMFYIYVKESSDHKELFPKLYPIGFIIKEKNPATKKTTYLLGEFNSREKAEEALKVVKKSGYAKAHIVEK